MQKICGSLTQIYLIENCEYFIKYVPIFFLLSAKRSFIMFCKLYKFFSGIVTVPVSNSFTCSMFCSKFVLNKAREIFLHSLTPFVILMFVFIGLLSQLNLLVHFHCKVCKQIFYLQICSKFLNFLIFFSNLSIYKIHYFSICLFSTLFYNNQSLNVILCTFYFN